MKFDIAAEDHEQAQADQEYHLEVFEIAGETYAAVRPAGKAFSALLKDSFGVRQDVAANVGLVLNFLSVCFDAVDLRAALIETGEYDPADGDRDRDLSDEGVELANSNSRITQRLMDRHDELGEMTLANVMIGLVEAWAGKDIGSPQDYLPPSKPTGKPSTARASSRTSTRSKSSTARRPASSRSATSG